MGKVLEVIAASNGCDLYSGSGTYNVEDVRSFIIRDEGTTITAVTVTFTTSGQKYSTTLSKNYIGVALKEGDLITFEESVTSFTLSVGSVMAYNG